MKFTFLIVLFTALGLSASAQWYNINLSFKKRVRLPQIALVKNSPLKRLPKFKLVAKNKIPKFTFPQQSDFDLEAQEAITMKTAQHHMRFREYDIASYNFTDLAELYIKQNRFSEAKWYLLQSNAISRPQFDDKHTITNLMDLAMVKANLGELQQSQDDLDEAHQIALSRGWTANVADIEKEQQFIKLNKTASSPKVEARYASDAMVNDKKAIDKKAE